MTTDDPATDRPRPAQLHGEVRLRATALSKAYGPTRALVAADVTLRAGQIVGMVGENGSGKSTLVKILSGVVQPNQGAIEIAGSEQHHRLRRPSTAISAGILTVFQEILVCQARSVIENIELGAYGLFRRAGDREPGRARAAALLERLAGRSFDIDAPVETLTIAEQQLVVIVRALVRKPRILILDESTSALDVADRERLFDLCRGLRADGTAILFITHRLEELLSLADEIVVIKDGSTVIQPGGGTVSRAAILDALARDRPPVAASSVAERATVDDQLHEAVVQADGVDLGGGAADVTIRRGTVVGVAGLEGHGQERFLRVLAGVELPDSGTVFRVHGDDLRARIRTRHDAARGGVYYLPRNRAQAGIFPPLSVLDNFALPTLAASARWGLIRPRSVRRRFEEFEKSLHIRVASGNARITSLSGGNQQKVLIARWLAADPAVLLLDDPTRGVDLPTKIDLHELLRDRASTGLAVVMVSTEIEELESVCDEVLVFHEQRIVARLVGTAIRRDAVLAAMFGQAQ